MTLPVREASRARPHRAGHHAQPHPQDRGGHAHVARGRRRTCGRRCWPSTSAWPEGAPASSSSSRPTIDYPAGARWRERYRIDDDRFIEGLKELVDVIHKHGCPTFMQMNHDGPWQADLRHIEPNQVFAGPPLGASPVSVPCETDFHNEVPRELTIPEIEGLVDKFAARGRTGEEGGLRRRRHQRREQPPAAQLPFALLEPARGHLRRQQREPLPLPLPGDPGDQAALRQGLRLHRHHQRARGRPGRGHRGQHDAHPADRPRERPLDREGRGRRHHGEKPLARLPRARLSHATCSSTRNRPSRWRSSPRSTTPSRRERAPTPFSPPASRRRSPSRSRWWAGSMPTWARRCSKRAWPTSSA